MPYAEKGRFLIDSPEKITQNGPGTASNGSVGPRFDRRRPPKALRRPTAESPHRTPPEPSFKGLVLRNQRTKSSVWTVYEEL